MAVGILGMWQFLNRVGVVGGGGGGVTWAAATNWTLSNGNLRATSGSSSDLIIGTAFKHSGTLSFTIVANGAGNRVIGVADASENLASGGFIGQSVHSLGYVASDGRILYNGGLLTTVAAAAAGDVVVWVINGDGTFVLKVNGATLFTTGVLALVANVSPCGNSNGAGLILDLDTSLF